MSSSDVDVQNDKRKKKKSRVKNYGNSGPGTSSWQNNGHLMKENYSPHGRENIHFPAVLQKFWGVETAM